MAAARGGVILVLTLCKEASPWATPWIRREALPRQEGGVSPLASMEGRIQKGSNQDGVGGPAGAPRSCPRRWTSQRPSVRTMAASLLMSQYCRPDAKCLDLLNVQKGHGNRAIGPGGRSHGGPEPCCEHQG